MPRKLQRANPVGTERSNAAPEQVQALNYANAVLRVRNTQLENDNAGLEAANRRLAREIKHHQVAERVLLAISGGLGVGLATGMAGATVQTALSSAAGVFFAVIMASMAVLAFMHR
jgi:hypothetical protein